MAQLSSHFARSLVSALMVVAVAVSMPDADAQTPPNPYKVVDGFIKLPAGRTWGAVGARTDPEGWLFV